MPFVWLTCLNLISFTIVNMLYFRVQGHFFLAPIDETHDSANFFLLGFMSTQSHSFKRRGCQYRVTPYLYCLPSRIGKSLLAVETRTNLEYTFQPFNCLACITRNSAQQEAKNQTNMEWARFGYSLLCIYSFSWKTAL